MIPSMRVKRDVALVLLGAWLTGTVFMAFVAAENFYLIDRLLASNSVEKFNTVVETLGNSLARNFMRYVSSELNRFFFVVWGAIEVFLGATLLWLVWEMASPRLRLAAGLMFGLALVLLVVLTPPIISVGRALDFVPRDPTPPELATFGWLHAVYSIADTAKLGLGVFLAVWIQRLPRTIEE